MYLNSLQERLNNPSLTAADKLPRECFVDWIKAIELPERAAALSISVGDGLWDHLAFLSNKKIKKIVATDVVDNPVKKDDVLFLNAEGKWEFVKVLAEKKLPFANESFDLIFHQDVVEHVRKPFLFLSEQYRVLKKGGHLILGTPNLFRPANIIKLVTGKLIFPVKIGSNIEIGDYVHIQEFHEQQLKIMLQEIGFSSIKVGYCFFGIHPLNITFQKYPKNGIPRLMCHFLMFKCSKSKAD